MMRIRVKSGSPLAEAMGFTSKLFYGYYDVESIEDGGNRIILLYILSLYPGDGNTTKLIQTWVDAGFEICVDRPNETMKHILNKFDFKTRELYPDIWGRRRRAL